MVKTYLPTEYMNQFSVSSHKMLFHILSNMKTGSNAYESQQIELSYNYFIDNNILSKNSYYKAISELVNAHLLFPCDKVKNRYYVNFYYMNAMTNEQWKDFMHKMLQDSSTELASNMFKNVKHTEVTGLLVKYDDLLKSMKGRSKNNY